MCKARKGFSRGVLSSPDYPDIGVAIQQQWRWQSSGGSCDGEIPDPIPNSVVKPISADDTLYGESRSPPVLCHLHKNCRFKNPPQGGFYHYQNQRISPFLVIRRWLALLHRGDGVCSFMPCVLPHLDSPRRKAVFAHLLKSTWYTCKYFVEEKIIPHIKKWHTRFFSTIFPKIDRTGHSLTM